MIISQIESPKLHYRFFTQLRMTFEIDTSFRITSFPILQSYSNSRKYLLPISLPGMLNNFHATSHTDNIGSWKLKNENHLLEQVISIYSIKLNAVLYPAKTPRVSGCISSMHFIGALPLRQTHIYQIEWSKIWIPKCVSFGMWIWLWRVIRYRLYSLVDFKLVNTRVDGWWATLVCV